MTISSPCEIAKNQYIKINCPQKIIPTQNILILNKKWNLGAVSSWLGLNSYNLLSNSFASNKTIA